MNKNVTLIIALCLSLLVLVACNQFLTESDSSNNKSNIVYQPSGRMHWCNQALQNANQQLMMAKLQASKAGLHGDWKFADDTMAEAVAAKINKDYDLCVAKSHVIINYIQRDKSYQHWKDSLNP